MNVTMCHGHYDVDIKYNVVKSSYNHYEREGGKVSKYVYTAVHNYYCIMIRIRVQFGDQTVMSCTS